MIHKDLQGFMRHWERICDTLGEDLQHSGRGFVGICEDSQGFVRLWEGICKTLGEDLQGFVRFWERICEDSQDS